MDIEYKKKYLKYKKKYLDLKEHIDQEGGWRNAARALTGLGRVSAESVKAVAKEALESAKGVAKGVSNVGQVVIKTANKMANLEKNTDEYPGIDVLVKKFNLNSNEKLYKGTSVIGNAYNVSFETNGNQLKINFIFPSSLKFNDREIRKILGLLPFCINVPNKPIKSLHILIDSSNNTNAKKLIITVNDEDQSIMTYESKESKELDKPVLLFIMDIYFRSLAKKKELFYNFKEEGATFSSIKKYIIDCKNATETMTPAK
jgi:hypothetical protein